LGKSAAAKLALKRFVTCVCPEVILKSGEVREFFAAVSANEFSFLYGRCHVVCPHFSCAQKQISVLLLFRWSICSICGGRGLYGLEWSVAVITAVKVSPVVHGGAGDTSVVIR